MTFGNICGWETGDPLEQAGALVGTSSIQSSVVRSGLYALRVNPTTTGTGYGELQGVDPTSGASAVLGIPTGYFRLYTRIDTGPSSGSEEIAVIRDTAAANKFHLRIDSSGFLSAWNNTGTAQLGSTGTTALSSGVFYCIEIKCGTGIASVPYEVRINGVTELSGTGALGNTNCGTLRCGKVTDRNGNSLDVYYDDAAIRDDDWCGPGIVLCLDPDSDGADTGWTIGAGSGSKWQQFERPVDTLTYLTSTGSVGNTYTAGLESAASAGVTGHPTVVKLIAMLRRETASVGAVRLRIRSGSATLDTTVDIGTGASYLGRCLLTETDPNTSAAWRLLNLGAVEVGVIERSANPSRVTGIFLMVEFNPLGTMSGVAFKAFTQVAAGVGRGGLAGQQSVSVASAANSTGRGDLAGSTTAAIASTTDYRGKADAIGEAQVGVSSSASSQGRGVIPGTSTFGMTSGISGNSRGRGELGGASHLQISDSADPRFLAALEGSAVASASSFAAATGKGVLQSETLVTLATTATVTGRGELSGASWLNFDDVADVLGRGSLASDSSVLIVTGQAGIGDKGSALLGHGYVSFASSASIDAKGTLSGVAYVVGGSGAAEASALAQMQGTAYLSSSGAAEASALVQMQGFVYIVGGTGAAEASALTQMQGVAYIVGGAGAAEASALTQIQGIAGLILSSQSDILGKGVVAGEAHLSISESGTIDGIGELISTGFEIGANGLITGRGDLGGNSWIAVADRALLRDANATGYYKQLHTLIRAQFKSLIEEALGLSVGYQNETYEPESTVDAWCSMYVLLGESKQADMGAALKRYRTVGKIVAQINVPLDVGEDRLMELADSINGVFRTITRDGITYRKPSVVRVGRVGSWFRYNVDCPFYSDTFA